MQWYVSIKKTGEYQTFRRWLIINSPDDLLEVDEEYDPERHIMADDPKATDHNVGDYIEESIPSVTFGRIAAQSAKQIIVQKVREAERLKVIKSYQERIGQLIHATVKKTTRDFVILDLGSHAEAQLKREEMLPKDNVRPGDRLRAYLKDIQHDVRGPQLVVSRSCPEMLIELFSIEVPEISEGVIEIVSAARDPGLRAKIAVKSNDGRIDPVGACVGMRGSRVQAVSNELSGERVDIVLWDENPAQYVINAMAPAEVLSIVVDEDAMSMDVAVAEDQLSQAIGRNGQNVRLASKLTGWSINVLTEADAADKQSSEQDKIKQQFIKQLGIDDALAASLSEVGFTSIEEIAYIPLEEFLELEDFDEETVQLLRAKANDALLINAITNEEQLESSKKPDDDLLELEGMDTELAYKLAAAEILTRDDLADLAVEDLLQIVEMDQQQASELIMSARAHWFK